MLLGRGADVNTHGHGNCITPLQAAMTGGHIAIAIILLRHGASKSDIIIHQLHKFQASVIQDTPKLFDDQARLNVDLNMKDGFGRTALHFAIYFCSPDIAKLLLE